MTFGGIDGSVDFGSESGAASALANEAGTRVDRVSPSEKCTESLWGGHVDISGDSNH